MAALRLERFVTPKAHTRNRIRPLQILTRERFPPECLGPVTQPFHYLQVLGMGQLLSESAAIRELRHCSTNRNAE